MRIDVREDNEAHISEIVYDDNCFLVRNECCCKDNCFVITDEDENEIVVYNHQVSNLIKALQIAQKEWS
jgi:hypothetical protein